jgi:calcium-dependent protein kinase
LTNEEEKKLCYVRPEKSFWIKNKGDEIDLDDIFSYVNDDILQEGYVMRRSLKTKKEKTHYYRLYKDRLERYADNTTDFASKILVLRGVKCEMLNIKDNKDFEETQDKFLLVFTLNQKFTILYLNIEKQFDEWSLAFRKTCILGYFGKFYKNRKVIGRGTFAKVLLSRNLANNHEYAVKTFDKKNLLSD